ncbi:MAG: hypothetical protein WDM76_05465 [Limisphaerales bacterium]
MDRLSQSIRAGNGGYDGVVEVTARGGSLKVENGKITVENADELIALMRIDRFRRRKPVGQRNWLKIFLSSKPITTAC